MIKATVTITVEVPNPDDREMVLRLAASKLGDIARLTGDKKATQVEEESGLAVKIEK